MFGQLTKSLAVLALIVLGASSVHAADPPSIVLTVPKMCCAKESVPAIKELNKVPGIGRVVADHKARTLTIVPKQNSVPSRLAIWEAAERVHLTPTRMAAAEGVYEKKPIR
jgi:hypothetical protein